MAAMLSLIYTQWFYTLPYPREDCTGKTIIVTGANVGLGKEAARHFVRLGAEKVILACRSAEKGEAAKSDLENSTKRHGVVEVWPLDLQDYSSVKAFAKRVNGLDRVDIIIENAGIAAAEFRLAEGHESTITVNVISTFLLALLVLPKLRSTGKTYNIKPTLTIVSSEVHSYTTFEESKNPNIFEGLDDPKTAKMAERYPVSKLLEVLVCREIAKEHSAEQLGVTLNFLNPGLCHSSLSRDANSIVLETMKLVLARSTEAGSRTLVHAGLQGPETHGKYLSNCQDSPLSGIVPTEKCPEIQKRVWDELVDILEKIQPGVTKVLDQ